MAKKINVDAMAKVRAGNQANAWNALNEALMDFFDEDISKGELQAEWEKARAKYDQILDHKDFITEG